MVVLQGIWVQTQVQVPTALGELHEIYFAIPIYHVCVPLCKGPQVNIKWMSLNWWGWVQVWDFRVFFFYYYFFALDLIKNEQFIREKKWDFLQHSGKCSLFNLEVLSSSHVNGEREREREKERKRATLLYLINWFIWDFM